MATLLALALTTACVIGDGAPPAPPAESVTAPNQETNSDEGIDVITDKADIAPTEPAYDVLDDLAMCESTRNWSANTGNGYFGGVQMDMVFWRRYGGQEFAARPDLATRAQQKTIAWRGQKVQGWRAWPVCSRRLGLR